jgi:hypothetical protein
MPPSGEENLAVGGGQDNAGEEPPAPADGRAHAQHGPVIVHPSPYAVKRSLPEGRDARSSSRPR